MMRNVRIAFVLFAAALIGAAPSSRADWASNGNAVCTMPNTQDTPAIASDGAGGAIIVWRDLRAGINTDIYIQRVGPLGAVAWTADGMPICTATQYQSSPLPVPDGAGGAIVVWQDFRSGNTADIYAQRVNSSGYVQWTANGLAVCTGKASLVLGQAIPDGSGGAIIVWIDRRSSTNDVFAQRINSSGAAQWTANGVTICGAAGSQTVPVLVSDGAGGALVAWQDSRTSPSNIYAQRIDAAGAVQWTADGIVICNEAMAQTAPQIVSDGSGGAIVAWTDRRNTVDDDIYAQRVDAAGAVQWTANGVGIVSSQAGKQSDCRIVPGAAHDAIVAWLDLRGGATADIYAQKVDAAGAVQWTANGVAVCTAANDQKAMQLIAGGAGGAVATWQDERGAAGVGDIYAQKIAANGTMAWTANGVAVSTAAASQLAPAIAPDGVGGAIMAWSDVRAGNSDIYAQRADAAGHTVTAALLQSFSAAASGADVIIEWTLSEASEKIEFSVLRAHEPPDGFVEIAAGGFPESVGGKSARSGAAFRFIDKTGEPGETYRYRVDMLEEGERSTLFVTGPVSMPGTPTALHQNRPNPFNPSTTITYYLSDDGDVSLEVYNVAGGLVRRLESGRVARGMRSVEWNGRDERGRPSSAGVYFCRLRAGKTTLSRTMILVR